MKAGDNIELIVDPDRWGVAQDDGEELVQVEIAPNVRIRMRRSEAIRRGLITQGKANRAARDKRRRIEGDK